MQKAVAFLSIPLAALAVAALGASLIPQKDGIRPMEPRHANLIDEHRILVVTEGGAYSGHWNSNDPDVPAVTIRTTEPVTLENCVLSGVGTLISTRYGKPEGRKDGVNPSNTDHADVTVRNCRANGRTPELNDRAPPRFLVALNPSRVDVQHNTIEGTRGISVFADPARRPTREVTVRFNTARNIDGRCRETCSDQNINGWVSATGIAVANLVQLADIRQADEVDVSWNFVRNEPGRSAVEDVISLFRVQGTKDRPVTVAHNLIIGAFPGYEPLTGWYSGSGIMIDGFESAEGPEWIKIFSNRVLFASSAGIGIAAGRHNEVRGNIVLRPERYSDGREITTSTVGVYVWKCCGEGGIDEFFHDNVAHSNAISVLSFEGGNFVHNNLWAPDCAVDADGASLCVDNVGLPPFSETKAERHLLLDWSRSREKHHGAIARPAPSRDPIPDLDAEVGSDMGG